MIGENELEAVMTSKQICEKYLEPPENPKFIRQWEKVKWVRQDTIREIMEALVDAERIAHYGQTNSERRVIVEYVRDTLKNWKVFSEVLR